MNFDQPPTPATNPENIAKNEKEQVAPSPEEMEEAYNREIEVAANRERERLHSVALAIELSEEQEILPFPGVDPYQYSLVKITEAEYPGFGTPIDELIVRLKNEGMKFVMSDDPKKSGTFFILPALSNDKVNDSILPRQLDAVLGIDDRLKQIILIGRSHGHKRDFK